MALTLALQNAVSGLRVNQSALSVLSNNIANSNNEDYSKQIVNQQAVYLGDTAAGVKIADITRNVDKYLEKAVQTQGSITAKSEVTADYMERLQLALGTPTTEGTLNARIDEFFASLQDLADNPTLVSVRESALSQAEALVNNINNLSSNMYDLRFEADRDISLAISQTNEQLKELYNVNIAIGAANAFNQGMSGLLDKRDALIKDISQNFDVSVNYLEDGRAHIFARGGIPMLDYELHKLQYIPAQSVQVLYDEAQMGQITSITIDPNTGATTSTPQILVDYSTIGTINTTMRNGKVTGLLELRDITLPNFINTLDEFAAQLRDSVNAIHNQGTGFPPPSVLNGQTYIDPTETRSWNGEFRMAVLDSDGTPMNNQFNTTPPGNTEIGGMRPLTLNFGFDSGEGQVGVHENQTIIDEINAFFGVPQTATHLNNLNDIKIVAMGENNPAGLNFTFDFDFSNITEDVAQIDITNVAVTNGVAGAWPATTQNVQPGIRSRTGTDFSFDVTSTGGVMFIDIDVQVTNATDLSVETATLRFTFDPTATDIRNDRYAATAVLAGTAVQEAPVLVAPVAQASLVDADGNPVGVGEAGYLKIEALQDDTGISIDELNSSDNGKLFDTPPVEGTGRGFSHFFGLNNFFNENRPDPDVLIDDITDMTPKSSLNLSIRGDILSNSNLIAAGVMSMSIQSPDPAFSPTYTYELGAGSKVVAQRLADLGRQGISFNDSGVLASTNLTFNSYASSFLGASSSATTFAKEDYDNNTRILEGYEERSSSIRSVNLDEEMGNTIVFQNAYAANARIVTVVNDMFDELLRSV